jgi:hypothetical protein
MSRKFSVIALLLASFTIGCTDDPDGTAPSISDLSLVPATLTAGQPNVMKAQLSFVDPDADVSDLIIAIELPDRSRQMAPPSDVIGSAGKTEGTAGVNLTIMPPDPGTYHFELWLKDANGAESNRLEASVQAQ